MTLGVLPLQPNPAKLQRTTQRFRSGRRRHLGSWFCEIKKLKKIKIVLIIHRIRIQKHLPGIAGSLTPLDNHRNSVWLVHSNLSLFSSFFFSAAIELKLQSQRFGWIFSWFSYSHQENHQLFAGENVLKFEIVVWMKPKKVNLKSKARWRKSFELVGIE